MMSYYLKQKTKKSPVFVITDKEGQKVNKIKSPKNAGISRVNWDLRYGAPDIPELGRTRRGRGPLVLPGEYNVTLKVEDQEMTKILKVAGDPELGFSRRQFSVQGGLSMIGSAIEGYSEAPKERQLQQIEEKQQELKTLIERINKIIQENIPRLNELLIANEIPHVFPVKIIKFKQ